MQGRAVLPNQPQAGIGDGRRVEGDHPVFSFFEDSALRRNELLIAPPLHEDIEELPNGGLENGVLNFEDGLHLVAGPVVGVNPGIEDEEVPLNDPLQQMEQEDLRAARDLLEQPIPGNVITPQHTWQIMHNLRDILPEEGPYRILSSHAEYARILRRTARVMTIPTREKFETARGRHSLDYDTLFQALQDSTPECPTEYGEVLEKLCDHLTAGASLMPGEDGVVFIFKDREEFGYSLRSLAARLTLVV